jgi:hypothetical protein
VQDWLMLIGLGGVSGVGGGPGVGGTGPGLLQGRPEKGQARRLLLCCAQTSTPQPD